MENINTRKSTFSEPEFKAKSSPPYFLYLLTLVSIGIGAAGFGIAISNRGNNIKQNENEITALQQSVEQLKRDNQRLSQDISSVRSKATQNEFQIGYLVYGVSNLERNLAQLKDDIAEGFTRDYDWYQPHNGYEYKAWVYQGKNWTQSRSNCIQDNAELAIYGMQDWQTRGIIFRALELKNADLPIFIGLNETENGQYMWLNGDLTDPEITFWSDTPKNGSCGILHPESLYTKTADCEGLYYSVCERPVSYRS